MLLSITACKHSPDVPPGPGPGTGNNNNNNSTGPTPCNPDSVYFQNDVLPILISNCAVQGCHDAVTKEDGVWLDSYSSLMASNIVDKGDAGNSDLYEVLIETDLSKRMPYQKPPLDPKQIELIKKWINQGGLDNKCQTTGCDTNQFTFADNISPIIQKNCIGCHSGTAPNGNILLSTHADVKVVADDGRLVGATSHLPGYKPMPQGGKLDNCDMIKIRKWVQAGAPNN